MLKLEFVPLIIAHLMLMLQTTNYSSKVHYQFILTLTSYLGEQTLKIFPIQFDTIIHTPGTETCFQIFFFFAWSIQLINDIIHNVLGRNIFDVFPCIHIYVCRSEVTKW